MSEATRQAALGALGSARSAAARLNPSRHPEDAAADIIEIWGSVETALRALLNGSPLSGQELVREVRKREMITLTQAHALLDFLAVRERVNDTSYQPTPADVEAARSALEHIEDSLTGASASAAAPAAGVPEPAPAASPSTEIVHAPRRRFAAGVPAWVWILLAVVALGGAGAASYVALRSRDDLAEGRRALRENRREAARAEFERVARENPRNADAHLFLARMAREQQDYPRARTHAEAAIRADTTSALGYREYGILLYMTGNYQLAQRFLDRAIRRDETDRTSQGMMACTLARMGQLDYAQRFANRAGPGPWSACVQ